jgi:two-component system chemotaxis response regulator CheY
MKVDPNMPVLIVDDYSTMVGIMRKLLRQIGFVNIDAASNAEEALEKIRTIKYGLIISDWHMQPVTGYDLFQRIRAEEPAADPTPFLFVTREPMQESDGAAQDAGASSYLEKPFSAAILKQKIDGIFGTLNGEAIIPAAPRAVRRGPLQS